MVVIIEAIELYMFVVCALGIMSVAIVMDLLVTGLSILMLKGRKP